MNLFTFNKGDDYEKTIADTKTISKQSCEDKQCMREFFIGVADGPIAGSPFE
jgi:hypothetical protein